MFTLFELVIFNPKHAETRGNLALLDVAGGYFSRLEYASHGSLPSSLVSEFAYIAREYVNNIHKPLDAGAGSFSSSAQALGQQNPNPNQYQGLHRRKPSASAAAMTLNNSTTFAPVGRAASDTNQHQEHHHAMLQDMNQDNNDTSNDNAGMAPLISSFAPQPMAQDESLTGMQVPPQAGMDHTSSSSPSGSVSMDGINFPMVDAGAFGGMPGSDFLLGTDVMDLFNYSVSGMDPFYLQAFDTQQP